MNHLISRTCIALACVGALCQQAALADSPAPRVEAPMATKVGGRFSYVDGAFLLKCNRWEVKEVANSAGLTVSKCGENTMYVTADAMNPVKAVNEDGKTVASFTPFYPDLSFPLFVGKKWTGQYKGQKGIQKWTSEVSCESAAFESVSTKAGKVDAFRIECKDNWDAGIIFINGTKQSTRWYAPSVGLIVKSINEDSEWNIEVAGADWK